MLTYLTPLWVDMQYSVVQVYLWIFFWVSLRFPRHRYDLVIIKITKSYKWGLYEHLNITTCYFGNLFLLFLYVDSLFSEMNVVSFFPFKENTIYGVDVLFSAHSCKWNFFITVHLGLRWTTCKYHLKRHCWIPENKCNKCKNACLNACQNDRLKKKQKHLCFRVCGVKK